MSSATLQPSDIASYMTAEEITTEITAIKTAISNARASASDKFADNHADIQVRRQKIADLNAELAIYIKAYNILTGNSNGFIEFVSGSYAPSWPRI